jgi:hypothetical protein
MKNTSYFYRFSVIVAALFHIVFNASSQEMGIGLVRLSGYDSSQEWVYINQEGNMISKDEELALTEFCDERLRKKINLKYGFANCRFDVVIRPVYEKARDFSNGFAAVRTNGKWGFINKKGLMVVQPAFEACEDFSDGMAELGPT